MPEKLNVFISHNHADQEIASVVNLHLQHWGISETNIFQSSAPTQGAVPGDDLWESIKSRLSGVNLFILIYTTFADRDWSSCTLEYGWATASDTLKTRTVIFRCTNEQPKWFQSQVTVPMTRDGIKDFTGRFHRDSEFIPTFTEPAIRPDVNPHVLQSRSDNLYIDLDRVIPAGRSRSVHLWDFLRLRLDAEHLEDIKNNSYENASLTIKKNTAVLEPMYEGIDRRTDASLRQFGYQSYEDGLKLGDIEKRWSEEDKSKSTAWIDEFHTAIIRAINNRDSLPVSNSFKSVRSDTDWHFFPIITRVRDFPDFSKELDVYLIRVGPALRNPKDT